MTQCIARTINNACDKINANRCWKKNTWGCKSQHMAQKWCAIVSVPVADNQLSGFPMDSHFVHIQLSLTLRSAVLLDKKTRPSPIINRKHNYRVFQRIPSSHRAFVLATVSLATDREKNTPNQFNPHPKKITARKILTAEAWISRHWLAWHGGNAAKAGLNSNPMMAAVDYQQGSNSRPIDIHLLCLCCYCWCYC